MTAANGFSLDSVHRAVLRELEKPHSLGRRDFLKITGIAGAGLVLGIPLRADAAVPMPSLLTSFSEMPLNAYVHVFPNGWVTVFSKSPEMGQGIKTALAMIIAEELDADWAKVHVEQAPINPAVYGEQWTNGSRSIRDFSEPMHRAGATARAMLVAVAAKEWSVAPSECVTAKSTVSHAASGRKLTYGELAQKAAQIPVPDEKSIAIKPRKDWKLIGTRQTGVDNEMIVTGKPLFGIDQKPKGTLYATYVKCPAQGGKAMSANLNTIRDMPGVRTAFILEGTGSPYEVMPGVAIVAESTWAALTARRALQVQWDLGNASKDDSAAALMQAQAIAMGGEPGKDVISQAGDVNVAFASASASAAGGKVLEAFYYYPFLAHANIEPMNTTAWVHDGLIEAWIPSQGCDIARELIAKVFKVPVGTVIVHQTRLGTGFGRRGRNDYACEAVAIAQKVNTPVKLQWTREDDTAHDFYRPAGHHAIKAAIDKSGKLTAWQNHFITFSHDGKDPVAAGHMNKNEFPAVLMPNCLVTRSMLPWRTECGTWRAPRQNAFVFVYQSFLHELSLAAKRDHIDFILEWIANGRASELNKEGTFDVERASAVVRKVAEMAGWKNRRRSGRALGFGFHPGNGGYVAEIAEVSVSDEKKITVHQVWAAVDAGPVIALSGAENQVVGSILDGFGSMMGMQIDFVDGRVKQSNFSDYPLLRIQSAPPVAVEFLQPDVRPTGLGEPALPPIIPAVCNAIFLLNGERIRSLPLSKLGYSA